MSEKQTTCACCHPTSADNIIYSDKVILSHVADINIPGYLIVAIKRHIEEWSELENEEAAQLMQVIQKTTKLLETIDEVERVYVCAFAELTRHLHLHIFPRYRNMLELADGILDGPMIFKKAREQYACKAPLVNPTIDEIITTLKNKLSFY